MLLGFPELTSNLAEVLLTLTIGLLRTASV
jgi:hypothetical protein